MLRIMTEAPPDFDISCGDSSHGSAARTRYLDYQRWLFRSEGNMHHAAFVSRPALLLQFSCVMHRQNDSMRLLAPLSQRPAPPSPRRRCPSPASAAPERCRTSAAVLRPRNGHSLPGKFPSQSPVAALSTLRLTAAACWPLACVKAGETPSICFVFPSCQLDQSQTMLVWQAGIRRAWQHRRLTKLRPSCNDLYSSLGGAAKEVHPRAAWPKQVRQLLPSGSPPALQRGWPHGKRACSKHGLSAPRQDWRGADRTLGTKVTALPLLT